MGVADPKRCHARQEASVLEDDRFLQAHRLAALGELSAGVAHEINNPLAVIRQEAELLQELLPTATLEDLPDGRDIQDSLKEIIQQVDRCKSITHNLLAYARKSEPVIQAVNVNDIVEDMVRLMEKEALHRNIAVIRCYQTDLPLVPVDAPQLRQVVLNLLNNAVQSIVGVGEIRIRTARVGSEKIEVCIQDTGCGIAPESLHKIFDPFFTTKPPGQGTGLGLSISQKIISRLGGTIAVESHLNQGSKFIIALPIQQPREDHA